MIGLFLFPILVCGYLFITTWPTERIRVSLYHGWSLYIRAAAFGIIIVTFIFISFGIILPKIGLLIGRSGIHLLPDTNIFKLLSDLIESSYIFRSSDSEVAKPSLEIASISIICIILTWLFTGAISIISKGETRVAKTISSKIRLEKIKDTSIERVFAAKSPIEHQLLVIAKKAIIDISYNKSIEQERKKVFEAIAKGVIDRKEKELMEEIFAALEYREINHALVTLENEKFYIGLPKIIPEPDEESVASNAVQIIPVWSGYRDEKKLLKFTTDYDFDLSETSSHDCISIPRDKILTVSGFKFETHKRLKQSSQEKNKTKLEKAALMMRTFATKIS